MLPSHETPLCSEKRSCPPRPLSTSTCHSLGLTCCSLIPPVHLGNAPHSETQVSQHLSTTGLSKAVSSQLKPSLSPAKAGPSVLSMSLKGPPVPQTGAQEESRMLPSASSFNPIKCCISNSVKPVPSAHLSVDSRPQQSINLVPAGLCPSAPADP